MSDHRPFTRIASVVFALVALAHVVRVGLAMDLVIDGFDVPAAVSVVAAIIAGCLSWATWRESRG